MLGQLKTEEKSNEITVYPELIKMLDIKVALVTIDTMACQAKMAKAIIKQGGDYLLASRKTPTSDRKSVLISASKYGRYPHSLKQGCGRIESRQCYVFNITKLDGDFSL
ncbi:ISAs1 family transposase [Aliivibrio logei]|uniref:ISAs1 family transposase n=1 Tax=Aliivibrio logei TaxID=688 RepID=UPI0035C93BC2